MFGHFHTPVPILLIFSILILVQFIRETQAVFNCASDDVLQHSSSEVIPVPLNPVGAGEWLSLVISVNQVAGNTSMVLRSLNANCNVEVKFRDYTASQNTYLRVYPKGRSAAYNLPNTLLYCSSYASLSIDLGLSAVSLGQELGLVLYPQTTGGGIVALFELWYRQRCPSDILEATDGFQLPPPPVTGESVSKTFDAVLSVPANPGYTKGLRVSIPPPLPTCSVETIVNSANVNWIYIRAGANYNDWKSAYVAIPFLGTGGNATELLVGAAGVIRLNLTYRAVCGLGASINSRFRPPFQAPILLNSTKSWATVELDITNVSARSVVMWRIGRENPATTRIIVENDLWNSTTSAMEFRDGFDTTTWFTPENFNSTKEMVVSLYVSSFMPHLQFAFRARLVSIVPALDQPPIPVTSESWQNLSIALEHLATSKWRLRSTRFDCRVEVGSVLFPKGYKGFTTAIAPESFNPNVSLMTEWGYDYEFNPFLSFGQEIGLGFDISQDMLVPVQRGIIQWPYRSHCMNNTLSPPLNSSWTSIEFKPRMHGLYLLPIPSSYSTTACSIDIFGFNLRSVGFTNIRAVCGDEWALSVTNRTIQTRPLAACGAIHITPLSGYPMVLIYRMMCAGDQPNEHPPRGNIGQVIWVSSDRWKTVRWKDSNSDLYYQHDYLPTKTFRAKQPDCLLELFARNFDLTEGTIVENLLDTAQAAKVPGDVSLGRQLETITYTSCTNKLYVQTEVQPWQQIKVRQICPDSESPYRHLCGQLERRVQATFNWQTVELIAWNPNQLRESMIQITLPAASDHHLAIELHFSSLVEQGLLGQNFLSRSGIWVVTNAARVRTNGFPAFLGMNRMFRTNVTITTDILAEKGDHIFTAKFRLRNLTESRTPSQGTDVLMATNRTQSLKFKIPPQFSEARRQRIVTQGGFFVEDEYGPDYPTGGRYYRWMFRHVWTIKPQTVGCRVRARVITLDIGLGDTVVGRSFTKHQHRLAIGPMTPDQNDSAFDGHKCDEGRHTERWPSLERSWTVAIANSSQNFVCAKVGPDYISNSSNGLVIRFESVSREMYEYEAEGEGEYERRVRSEAEETWGSGWELEYSQVCDDERVNQIVNRPLIQVAASSKLQTLPIFEKESATWELFKDIRYQIIPSKQKCQVRVLWKTSIFHYSRILKLFDDRGHQALPDAWEWEYDPSSDKKYELNVRARNFTVLVHSKIPSKRQGRFVFRQDCNEVVTGSPSPPQTQSPTSSPTLFPTVPAPTYSPTQLTSLAKDGFSCYKSDQCQSGICSMTLMSCLSQACATQCKAYSTPSACNAFAQARCVCRWDPGSKQCLILP